MHVLMVHIHVKPERLEDFLEIVRDNASNSVLEAGVVRFDVFQQKDDPTRITLVEVYHAAEDYQKHITTAHFLRFRDRVEDMMAEPRTRMVYSNIFPADDAW